MLGPYDGSPRLLEHVVHCLLGLATVFGEVVDVPVIVARVTGRCELLWWPDCHLLLLLCWKSAVVLLLLRVVAPELWWRSARLSRG
jgi:hypothetical protein